MKKIILASNSPRRKEILKAAGIKFEIKTAKCKEFNSKHFDIENVKKNSQLKVSSVIKELNENALVIGADTVVILDSVCLVKPQSFFEALFILKKLSNRTHSVITSHTIQDKETGKNLTETSTSFVTFKKLGLFEIIRYLILKKPYDKAGSYGIQDFINEKNADNPPETSFIKKLKGSYYNVMGLDINVIKKLLAEFEK